MGAVVVGVEGEGLFELFLGFVGLVLGGVKVAEGDVDADAFGIVHITA